jgi:hypothetical protein
MKLRLILAATVATATIGFIFFASTARNGSDCEPRGSVWHCSINALDLGPRPGLVRANQTPRAVLPKRPLSNWGLRSARQNASGYPAHTHTAHKKTYDHFSRAKRHGTSEYDQFGWQIMGYPLGSRVSDPRVSPTARSDLFPKTTGNGAAFNFYGPTKNVFGTYNYPEMRP